MIVHMKTPPKSILPVLNWYSCHHQELSCL
nr:MAG TPA: hypothetical protein [Caudoviricetes sp.]